MTDRDDRAQADGAGVSEANVAANPRGICVDIGGSNPSPPAMFVHSKQLEWSSLTASMSSTLTNAKYLYC